MNCLSHISLRLETIFRSSSQFRARTCHYGAYARSWTRTVSYSPCIIALNQSSALTRFGSRLYSEKAGESTVTVSRSRRKSKAKPEMEKGKEKQKEKEAFYVVRKGDVVGVYRSLNDCQAQVGSSICDPPVSVFKGNCLPKETEEYLTSRGLKDAIYSIRAEDVNESLFGPLVQCALQSQEISASSIGVPSSEDTSKKRSQQVAGLENVEDIGSISTTTASSKKHAKLDHSDVGPLLSNSSRSCILKFDGASKGNPGKAGAGALLLADDGSLICNLREGLGEATCNAAEYRAIILGLKHALKKGFEKISVQGDSKLVCMQVQGSWKVKNENMLKLYKEVKKLKEKFLSFEIKHVLRVGKNLNAEADAQANLAITLADGEVLEETEAEALARQKKESETLEQSGKKSS